MAILDALTAHGQAVPAHRPWPRVIVDAEGWRDAIEALAAGALSLVSEWGDATEVHLAVTAEGESRMVVLSLACPERRFPSVGASHPPAIRLERAIRDLFGLEPEGFPDRRPWLDHGRWAIGEPLGRKTAPQSAEAYAFLTTEGENLHQIPVGPVHAGIIEPGHFRFTASGETIARLEERLGYVHKGIDSLMAGADIAAGARLAGRTSGDSTVAYALAFSRAIEAALGIEAPPRATWLRALMLELERLANHFGDIGAICNDASFALMMAHCAMLRERVLRFSQLAFAHRLMMDAIVPGGVGADLGRDAAAALPALLAEIRAAFPRLINLYDSTTSLQDRTVGTGTLTAALATQYAAGGYVGRASGRAFDARKAFAFAPYGELKFDVPTLYEGDVNARVWIRIREVEQSLALIDQITDRLPDSGLRTELPDDAGEGIAIVEGFRGEVLASVRLARDGRIERCHLRDPSWFQWPLLEAVVEGNIVADFPLCNKSFNCSYSGHDL
ncbi:MAG: NADH-quinone oxidoreductase subunit C [Bauldia sp.]